MSIETPIIGAGSVNPRRLVRAQQLLAQKAGARIIRDAVVEVKEQKGSV